MQSIGCTVAVVCSESPLAALLAVKLERMGLTVRVCEQWSALSGERLIVAVAPKEAELRFLRLHQPQAEVLVMHNHDWEHNIPLTKNGIVEVCRRIAAYA